MASSAIDVVVRTRGQRELEALQKGLVSTEKQLEQLQGKAKQQGSTTAQLANQLRRLKGDYDKLTNAAKASAKAGGEGFSKDTVNRLRGLSTEIERTRQAFLESKSATANYKQALDSVAQSTRNLSNAKKQAALSATSLIGRLGGLRGALLSLGITAVARQVIGGAASFEQLELRLKSLSKEYGETERLQQFVGESAKQFGQSQQEAAAGVADVYARLRPLGISLDEIETVYKGFNATALASGTSAEAASSAFLQLSQALGSGTLQGDEFRSIAEQVPGILRLVADEMGVTVGELKQLGADGKITADIMINALAKGFELNKDKIQEMLALSPAQRFKEFQNAASELSNALGSELLPALIPIVQGATNLLREFGKLPGPVKTITAAVLGLTAAFVALAPAISAVAGLLGGLTLGGLIAAAPWLALAAGVVAVGAAFAEAAIEKDRMDQVMRSGTAAQLETEINRLRNEIEAASDKSRGYQSELRGVGAQSGYATVEVQKLKAQLANLEGIYKVRIEIETLFSGGGQLTSSLVDQGYGRGAGGNLTYTVAGITYDAKTGKPITPAPKPFAPTGGGSGSKGGGGGGGGKDQAAEQLKQQMEAGRELSRQFTQQIALLNAKSELQRTLLQLQQQEEDGILRIKETAAASQQADLIKQQQLVTQLEQLKAIDEFTKSQTQSAVDLVEQTKQLVANDARRKELIAEGLNPALAESFVQIEQQFDKQRELLDATLLTLETELAREGVNGAIAEEIQGQIDKIKELKGELDKAEGDQKKSAEGEKTGKIQDYMNKLQEQLADTEGMVVSLAQTVEGEIGSAMSNAITGLIDGTMTAEQAFSQMFKNIGKAFIDMATQMIAKALILKALGILFPGSSGAGGFGGFSGAGPFSQAGGWNFEGPGMAGFGANMSFMAEGGYVTGPTNALIGEGGEPEYVIPESKMGTAMSRWNEGARGDSILEGGSGSGGSDSGLNLSMSFQTTQFMDREWVDRQQLEAAMAQASARGAKQGEAATLRRLQMSAATRRKLGF